MKTSVNWTIISYGKYLLTCSVLSHYWTNADLLLIGPYRNIQPNAFQNVVCVMSSILFQPRYVNERLLRMNRIYIWMGKPRFWKKTCLIISAIVWYWLGRFRISDLFMCIEGQNHMMPVTLFANGSSKSDRQCVWDSPVREWYWSDRQLFVSNAIDYMN